MPDHVESKTEHQGNINRAERYTRKAVAGLMRLLETQENGSTKSERKKAKKVGIPRTTVQYWKSKKARLQATPAEIAFFESPEGVEFLHRYVVASHLVMSWMGACGIRLICLLIELTGMAPFIADSYGTQQSVSAEMQEALVAFGEEERKRLSTSMPHKKITVCEDETFLSEDICLVAMEPASGFILVEDYVDQRDAETWDAKMAEATTGMDIEVIQVTADEGSAIALHTKRTGAKHAPDLFHPQHDICRAMALPLSSKEAKAKEAYAEAMAESLRQFQAERAYLKGPRCPGRPPDFAKRIQEAQAAEEETARQLDRIRNHRLEWKAAVHRIGELYHPFNLDSGAPQTADKVSERLEGQFGVIMKIVAEEGLSEACKDRVRKAHRVVPKMVSTVAFFHGEVQRRVGDLRLPPDQERLLLDNLIPSAYLQGAASRTQDHDEKARIRKTLDEFLSERLFPGGPASLLTAEEQRTLEKIAYESAEIFQRSSSCIEGRNGLLEQWEHAMRRLQPKKLRGLTVIHNYFIKRPDGLTAAERFFERPPRDLFDWLLAHVRLPARSAMNRKTPIRLSLFQSA